MNSNDKLDKVAAVLQRQGLTEEEAYERARGMSMAIQLDPEANTFELASMLAPQLRNDLIPIYGYIDDPKLRRTIATYIKVILTEDAEHLSQNRHPLS